MTKLYISYANEDLSVASALRDALTEIGISSTLVDHTNFNYDGDVAASMLDSIKNSDVMVSVFSTKTNNSNFVSIELNAAVKREKKVYIFNTDKTTIDAKNHFVTANSVLLKSTDVVMCAAELKAILNKGEENG